MNKGISFYWGYQTSPSDRAKLLKSIGFDCIITNADKKFNKQNGKIKEQVELFKANNLKLSSLHMQYKSSQLQDIWKKGLKGILFCKRLKKDIKLANKYGFTCVVVHIKGSPNQLGYKRLHKILDYCQKLNIPLAIENINNQECFAPIFENVEHPYLKFCYDIGHNNAFDPNFDYLKKYGNKLICLHLHDNRGEKDDHTLNKYGTINWQAFAKKLKALNYTGNLDYEVLMCYRQNETAEQVAKQVYEQACELEKMIEQS